MKNLLAKFGTKKVAGVAIAVATVVAGVGLIGNFSGNSSQGIAERNLSVYTESATNSYGQKGQISRAELERQMEINRENRSNKSIESLRNSIARDKRFASNREGTNLQGNTAMQGQVNSFGTNDNYANSNADNNAVATPNNQAMYDSAYENVGGAISEGIENKSNNGAENNADIDENISDGGSLGTQRNVLQSSRGTSADKLNASGKGGSSGSSSNSSYQFANSDSNVKAIKAENQQIAKAETIGNTEAFKNGRLGAMGGIDANVSGGNNGAGSGAYYSSAREELLGVNKLSNKALQTQNLEGMKHLADAAFQGGEDPQIGTEIGESVNIGEMPASDLGNFGLTDSAPAFNAIREKIDTLEAEKTQFDSLKGNYWGKLALMLGITVAAVIGIKFCRRIPAPWGYIAAGVVTAAAVAGLALIMFNGENSIFGNGGIIDQMKNLTTLNPSTGGFVAGGILMGVAGIAAIALAWVSAIKANAKAVEAEEAAEETVKFTYI